MSPENLREDLMTEKMDMQERIEAGIATQEQIEEYMSQDIAFMNATYDNDFPDYDFIDARSGN